jgi:hypothetical protein
MAKSTKALLMGRIQMCKTNPSIAHIGLATHGRSIQIGSSKAGRALISDVNLFGNCKRIIHFNAEVAGRALDLRVTKKELDGS